jgi:hypothetical protein
MSSLLESDILRQLGADVRVLSGWLSERETVLDRVLYSARGLMEDISLNRRLYDDAVIDREGLGYAASELGSSMAAIRKGDSESAIWGMANACEWLTGHEPKPPWMSKRRSDLARAEAALTEAALAHGQHVDIVREIFGAIQVLNDHDPDVAVYALARCGQRLAADQN